MIRSKNPKIREAETMKEIHTRVMNTEKKNHEKKTLQDVYDVYQKWLYFEDTDVIDLTLATALTSQKKGTPIWIIVIGRSGGGKSQLIRALAEIPNVKMLDNLTPNALASGAKEYVSKGKTRKVNDLGTEWEGKSTFVLTSDLATLSSKNKDEKKAIFAAFRELFDGYVTKDTGNEVSRKYTDCHVTWLFGATPAIRSEVLIYAELGTRELMYDMPYLEESLDAKMEKAWNNENHEANKKKEMQLVAKQFYNSHKYDETIDAEHMKTFIFEQSKKLEYLRGTAATDRSTGELITKIVRADSMRSMIQFKKLYRGLKSLDTNYPDEKTKRIITQIVNSSGDPVRMEIMRMHERHPKTWYTMKEYVERNRVGKKTIKKQLMALWCMEYLVRDAREEQDIKGRVTEVEYFKKSIKTQMHPPTPYIDTEKKDEKINKYIEGGKKCDLYEKIKKAIEENLNTYEDLCEIFNIETVEKMKKEGVLIPINGGKRYEFK